MQTTSEKLAILQTPPEWLKCAVTIKDDGALEIRFPKRVLNCLAGGLLIMIMTGGMLCAAYSLVSQEQVMFKLFGGFIALLGVAMSTGFGSLFYKLARKQMVLVLNADRLHLFSELPDGKAESMLDVPLSAVRSVRLTSRSTTHQRTARCSVFTICCRTGDSETEDTSLDTYGWAPSEDQYILGAVKQALAVYRGGNVSDVGVANGLDSEIIDCNRIAVAALSSAPVGTRIKVRRDNNRVTVSMRGKGLGFMREKLLILPGGISFERRSILRREVAKELAASAISKVDVHKNKRAGGKIIQIYSTRKGGSIIFGAGLNW